MAASLLIVALVAWCVGRSGFVFSGDYGPSAVTGTAGVIAVVAIGSLAASLLVIASGRLPRRACVGVLGIQALLALAPYLVLGGIWGPVAGAAVASALFALPRRASVPASVLLLAADIGLSALFQEAGVPRLAPVGRLVIDVLVATNLLGMMLLADLTRRVVAERTAHTALAVAGERHDNAAHLRAEVGADLSAVLRLSEPGVDGPDARARLAEMAAHAHRAARAARSVMDTAREIPPRPAARDALPETVVSPRLARSFTLAATLGATLLVLVNLAFYADPDAIDWTVGVLVLLVSGALQMYHGAPPAAGRTPRRWLLTLPFHAVLLMAAVALTGLPFVPVVVLMAGAVLYRCRPPWSIVVVLVVSGQLLLALPPGSTPGDGVYLLASLVASLSQVYAYCRLPEAARALAEAREGLTRLAVVRERLRVARDVHDLLGLGITGIRLKCELIARLVDTDPARARHEMRELRGLAERGLAEIRTVTSATPDLDFGQELEAVRSLLSASGIRTEVTVDTDALPPGAGALLAMVLREAVTNVIRHSAAGVCRISLTVRDGTARLRVVNDGGTGRATAEPAGTGLAGLAARLTAAGGRLGTEADSDRFALTAQIGPGVADPGRLDPARLGRDADRVDPVPGVELGHR
ncbi:histidine kinase [Streptomyces sp. RFCAC02]|uniref:sensor histidine kinase n=1 Tax=Streptomyces sp. RFCAC02 TaxID=2499143 RepID=UPI001020C5C6|nr:histidine kinase [Streptomyces sp. RFCAC02]